MNPGATFERVYLALKEQLGSGRYAAGEHLEPAALSQDLCASITPVRDALHRLVGEGLAEAPRGDGFRSPFITEVGLRHLYRWNASLLDLATRPRFTRACLAGSSDVDSGDPLSRTEQLFVAIAACSGNPEHVAAIVRLNERFRPVRRAERDLFPQLEHATEEMAACFAGGSAGPLRRAITLYHRKRQRLAAEIVAALHRVSGNPT